MSLYSEMAQGLGYAVVHFLETHEVEAVPASWLESDKIIYWPPFTQSALEKAITKAIPVDKVFWEKYKIRIMGAYRELLYCYLYWYYHIFSFNSRNSNKSPPLILGKFSKSLKHHNFANIYMGVGLILFS